MHYTVIVLFPGHVCCCRSRYLYLLWHYCVAVCVFWVLLCPGACNTTQNDLLYCTGGMHENAYASEAAICIRWRGKLQCDTVTCRVYCIVRNDTPKTAALFDNDGEELQQTKPARANACSLVQAYAAVLYCAVQTCTVLLYCTV